MNSTVIAIIVAIAIASFAGAGGYKVGALSCVNSKIPLHEEVTRLQSEANKLSLAIAEHNSNVDVARAQADAAVHARKLAERHATDMAIMSESRMLKLEDAFKEANDCDGVLRRYWDLKR